MCEQYFLENSLHHNYGATMDSIRVKIFNILKIHSDTFEAYYIALLNG